MPIYINGGLQGGYRSFTTGTPTSTSFLTPTSGSSLFIGDTTVAPEIANTFSGTSAVFSEGSEGINYFVNAAVGVGGIPLGGAYLSTRSRGSGGSESAALSGDYLGGIVSAAHDGSAYASNSSGSNVLPGVWSKLLSDCSAGLFESNVWIGGAFSTHFEVQMRNSGGPRIGFFGVTPIVRPSAYTPTNVVSDRSYNANATTVDELADVLGTLIADLQSYGLLQ